MHVKNKYTYLKHLDFLAVDIIALMISFTTAFRIKFGGWWVVSGPEWSNIVWLRLAMLLVFLDVIITLVTAPYSDIFRRPYYMEAFSMVKLAGLSMISVALTVYIFKVGADYSRAVFIMTYCFYTVLAFFLKYFWKKFVISEQFGIQQARQISLFVVADRNNIDNVLANISAGDYNKYIIRGIYFVNNDKTEEATYCDIPVVATEFTEYIIRNNIGDVLITVPLSGIGADVYKRLVDNAVAVHIDIESMIGVQTENQYVDDVGICKTLSVGAFTFSLSQLIYLVIKRILDIIFGIIGVIVMVPVSLAIKISYLLSGDNKSIFYTQRRVGLNGKLIRMFKYRTMVADADKVLEELLKDEKYRREWEENQKLTDDPRITPAGRLLRRLSIDELPQAINMLAGSMSLVGPRPLVEGELEAHDGLKLYQRVKPGITGWWGCNGRSNIEYRERLELEYYYIKNFSMHLDVLCVLRTIYSVLKKDGAR